MKASEAFRDTFGSEVKELNAGAIVAELRKEVARHEDTVSSALGHAHRASTARRRGARRRHRPDEGHPPRLGGQRDRDVQRVSHRAIKDAIKRAVELEQALTEPRLHDLERARKAQASLGAS